MHIESKYYMPSEKILYVIDVHDSSFLFFVEYRCIICFSFYFQALEMLSDGRRSVPIIFLVTDGTVEDEKETCDMINKRIRGESIFPRIYTLGIGITSLFYYI